MLSEAINVFVMEPRNDLLSNRETNETYLLAESGRQTLQGGKQVQIKQPDAGHWAAVILPAL